MNDVLTNLKVGRVYNSNSVATATILAIVPMNGKWVVIYKDDKDIQELPKYEFEMWFDELYVTAGMRIEGSDGKKWTVVARLEWEQELYYVFNCLDEYIVGTRDSYPLQYGTFLCFSAQQPVYDEVNIETCGDNTFYYAKTKLLGVLGDKFIVGFERSYDNYKDALRTVRICTSDMLDDCVVKRLNVPWSVETFKQKMENKN